MSRFLLWLIVLGVGATSPNVAQNQAVRPTKIEVFVQHVGEDDIGRQLAYEVREELRRSAAYFVGTPETGIFQIRLISIDEADKPDRAGNLSVVGVTYTMANGFPYDRKNPQSWYALYLSSAVMLVGRQRVEEQAKSIVASLDAGVQRYRSGK